MPYADPQSPAAIECARKAKRKYRASAKGRLYKDRLNAYYRRYYWANWDWAQEKRRRWYQDNKGYFLAYLKRWRKTPAGKRAAFRLPANAPEELLQVCKLLSQLNKELK